MSKFRLDGLDHNGHRNFDIFPGPVAAAGASAT
jgi:hypothetical protein